MVHAFLSSPIVAVIWGISMNDLSVIERIGVAFETLDQLPDWYQYALIYGDKRVIRYSGR